MEKKRQFLQKLVRFGGWLEMSIAMVVFLMGYIEVELKLGTNSLPFFYQFAGVELFILGFLLWYSARDIKRYKVIIIASCIFRYIMALWPQMQAMITLWPNLFAVIIVPGLIYDIISATLTLYLLKHTGYLEKS